MLVYIREAHAIDGASPNPAVLVEEPLSDLERLDVAQTCMAKLELEGIPAVIDRIDNAVDTAYQAKPDRLYLVGKDGRIAYAGARGPLTDRSGRFEHGASNPLKGHVFILDEPR